MIPDLSLAPWRRSSHSGPEGGDCVEVTVSRGPEPTIAVRDSKNPNGAILAFGPTEWRGLIRQIKADHLTE